MNRFYSALAVVALLVVLALGRFVGSETGPTPSHPDQPETAWSEPLWTGGIANAERHWRKHGSEFPEFTTQAAYIAGAHRFIDHPPAGTLTKERGNGDILFYDPGNNTFAVRASDGAPRTFFRPNNGMAYWQRQ